ncbi:hypothetical protein Agub_g11657, partial [Astrephomene gubernaculifera]
MPIYGLPYSDDQLFNLLNLALPAWILLAVAPRWRYTQIISTATALLMSALYVALFVTMKVSPPEGEQLDFNELFTFEGVARALSTRSIVLPAWTHYIAFDLWVGRWIAADAVSRGVPQLLVGPCLLATLLVGPTGLLLYWLVRA